MTLNVSLRVPDGIVIASDSLSTFSQSVNQKMNVSGKCDKCGEQVELKDVQTPPLAVPSSTWPYTQKLFPIDQRFGLMAWGSAFVNNRSIYNHVVEIAPRLPAPDSNSDRFQQISDFIVEYFKQQLLEQWSKIGVDPNLQPDSFRPFGFQFVGHGRNTNGELTQKTHLISIGKSPIVDEHSGIGCSVSGDVSVVTLLWPKSGAAANFSVFSMQDAIDYARFLISTTANYQRFSGNLPTVGGEIDVALVTNYRGFRWIAQKELYRMLEKEETAVL